MLFGFGGFTEFVRTFPNKKCARLFRESKESASCRFYRGLILPSFVMDVRQFHASLNVLGIGTNHVFKESRCVGIFTFLTEIVARVNLATVNISGSLGAELTAFLRNVSAC